MSDETTTKVINRGGPAFARPASVDTRHGTLPDGDMFLEESDGMSLRDYFAAKAMQGFSANPDFTTARVEEVASAAYAQADAMIEARES